MKISLSKDIAAERAVALLALDEAMAARRRALTGANADLYALKFGEARAFLDGDLTIGETTFLQAEAGLRMAVPEMLAEEIVERHTTALRSLGAVELLRQQIQSAIRAAGTPAEIATALALMTPQA